MRIELDAGNTRLKWRKLDRGRVVDRGVMSHKKLISDGLYIESMEHANQIVVSSVADDAVRNVVDAAARACNVFDNLVHISAAPRMAGVNFVYEDVSRLGVDRCLAMVGAYSCCKEGVLVVDCGSAITADFVKANGDHVGGFILPGLQMLKETLLSGTANVIVESSTDISMLPGESTEECVEHGRYFLLHSLISGLIEKALEYEINTLAITGGDGALVARLLNRDEVFNQDLVFEGMKHVVLEC